MKYLVVRTKILMRKTMPLALFEKRKHRTRACVCVFVLDCIFMSVVMPTL